LYISIKYSWVKATVKWYLFNFSWDSLVNKIINVFIWWLHLVWVPSTVASLSLRLFGNIFAWIILIWVLSYLWVLMTSSLFEIWRFISIPFWFFEIFVAFIQALVFAWLMVSYFNQSKSSHH
jgi:F0F1-type ATP synthase membrane subunit a